MDGPVLRVSPRPQPARVLRWHLYKVSVEALCVTLEHQKSPDVLPSVREGLKGGVRVQRMLFKLLEESDDVCSDVE